MAENLRVVVRFSNGQKLKGTTQDFKPASPRFHLIPAEGGAPVDVRMDELKAVFFVRDLQGKPSRNKLKGFLDAPAESSLGKKVAVRFRDGDVMDGILSNNLLQLEPYGFTFIPPEPYSNNQKIFCPREALSEFHVLGVVGSPLTRRRRKEVPKEQIGLFEQE
jgi:small nuclear ribonucleoprotein (snRNP)-like protein